VCALAGVGISAKTAQLSELDTLKTYHNIKGEFWAVFGINAYATICLGSLESRAKNLPLGEGHCDSLPKH